MKVHVYHDILIVDQKTKSKTFFKSSLSKVRGNLPFELLMVWTSSLTIKILLCIVLSLMNVDCLRLMKLLILVCSLFLKPLARIL